MVSLSYLIQGMMGKENLSNHAGALDHVTQIGGCVRGHHRLGTEACSRSLIKKHGFTVWMCVRVVEGKREQALRAWRKEPDGEECSILTPTEVYGLPSFLLLFVWCVWLC